MNVQRIDISYQNIISIELIGFEYLLNLILKFYSKKGFQFGQSNKYIDIFDKANIFVRNFNW